MINFTIVVVCLSCVVVCRCFWLRFVVGGCVFVLFGCVFVAFGNAVCVVGLGFT